MKIEEFINEILIGQIGLIQNIGKTQGKDCHYLSFLLICSGIEFLGSCLDEHDFHKVGLSRDRFKRAIVELFPPEYHKHAKTLYESLRCGIVHSALPKSDIGLTQEKESTKYGTRHLVEKINRLILISETFYTDFKNACEELKGRIRDGKLAYPKLQTDFFSVPGDKLPDPSRLNNTTSNNVVYSRDIVHQVTTFTMPVSGCNVDVTKESSEVPPTPQPPGKGNRPYKK